MRASDLVALLMTTSQPWAFHSATATTPPMVLATGTRNARDLLDDIDVRGRLWPPLSREKGRAVHRGISGRALRMRREVESLCVDATDPLVLAGWSLGGGSVMCLAAHLVTCDVPIHSVHIFGSPGIASAAFASWYAQEARLEGRTWRYVTPRDPVPLLRYPFHRHVGGSPILIPCSSRNPIAHHDLATYYRGLVAHADVDVRILPAGQGRPP